MSGPFPLTAAAVAGLCGGRLVCGEAHQPLPTFSTDTRTLQPGDTFIALVGPNFDGEAFVDAAIAKGTRGVIVTGAAGVERARTAGIVAVLVGDTLDALQALARGVRRLSGARVVAITGSTGKTTTKEAAATLVETRFRTMRNRGNLNNHIGLPLSLLELQAGAEVAVVELGMNHAGEISKLVEIAEPDIRVWTNVGTAHLEFFGSMDAIARAKAEVLERATPETIFVANADDARVAARVAGFPGRTVTFGVRGPADVQAVVVDDRGVEGVNAEVRTSAGPLALALRLPGRGHLANVLAATAVALQLGVPLTVIEERAATLTPAPHRGEVRRLARGIRVFDDCYNASPGALLQALETVAASATAGRKVAVIGEMLELGPESEALHRQCGRAAVTAGIARLLTVGGSAARALGEAAVAAGLPVEAVAHVDDTTDAAGRVVGLVDAGDLVLVKGSRGIRLERVVERLVTELA